MEKLEEIKSEIDYIKEHMVLDPDVVLTRDDLESLEEAKRDFKAGRTERL